MYGKESAEQKGCSSEDYHLPSRSFRYLMFYPQIGMKAHFMKWGKAVDAAESHIGVLKLSSLGCPK